MAHRHSPATVPCAADRVEAREDEPHDPHRSRSARRDFSNELRRLNETTGAQGMNLPGWGLHPLKGRELKGHFSVWVRGNWRLTFTFEGTDAVLVNDVDHH